MFASLERSPFTAGHLRGTDFLVMDRYGHGHMFTPEQAEREKQRHEAEMNADEEVVLYVRVVASDRGSAAQYAFLKSASPSLATPISPKLPAWRFDGKIGFGVFASGRVSACSTLDGAPAAVDEHSILLGPGKAPCWNASSRIAAARALDFFLEKQHASGFMQNFNGYILETGAVLWTRPFAPTSSCSTRPPRSLSSR